MALIQLAHTCDGHGNENLPISVTERTYNRVLAAKAEGAVIIVTRNWRYTGRQLGFVRVEKISQTNDRSSGRPKHVIWACYTEQTE